MAIRNAAVLPVPVCACPAMSFPAKAIGRVLLWMGVQNLKPAALIPCNTCPSMGRDSNFILALFCFKIWEKV